MPAHPPTPRMLGRVITITAEVRQIDAADKRDLVVDHDQLLVVAVHRTLVRVQRRLDPRPAHELIAPRAHRGPARREHRHRSARPQQHANVDRLGRLAQQLAQQHRRLVTDEREPRRDAPPRDQHTTPRGTDRLLERREVRRAVDQHLDRVARPRRRITRRPQAPVIRRRALRGAPKLAQPASMMSARQTLDRSSRNAIGHSKDIHRHHAQTIRRPSAATSGATARRAPNARIQWSSRHTPAISSALTEKATAYGPVLVLKAVVGPLGAGAQGHGMDR